MRAALQRVPRATLWRWTLSAALFLLASCAPNENATSPPPTLLFLADPTEAHYGSLEVRGLHKEQVSRLKELNAPEDWEEVFAVFTGPQVPSEEQQLPAILGDYELEGSCLRFTPRYPFSPGSPYTARWKNEPSVDADARIDEQPVVLTFHLPSLPQDSSTFVTQIFPTTDEVPENLLKFYLHFSSSMSRGEASQHIRLENAEGKKLPYPFVAPHQELWNESQDRLTLILDPGRIKRNVGPNLEMGPPLTAGSSFRLVIDAAWQDGRRQPLTQGFEKRFRVGPADRISPNLQDWEIVPPAATNAPLVIHFPEPLDRALLDRLLKIFDSGGQEIQGKIEVEGGERQWSLSPSEPWREGTLELRVATTLEDLAGNTFEMTFDTALPQVSPAPGETSPASQGRPGFVSQLFTISFDLL